MIVHKHQLWDNGSGWSNQYHPILSWIIHTCTSPRKSPTISCPLFDATSSWRISILASFTMWFEKTFANKMCMNRMEYPNFLVGLVFWQIWNRIDFWDLAMLHRLWKESYQQLVFLHNLEWQMEATFSLCRFWFTTNIQQRLFFSEEFQEYAALLQNTFLLKYCNSWH